MLSVVRLAMNITHKAKLVFGLVACVFAPAPIWASDISAFIEPYRDVDIASSEMGTLAYLNVKEGDRVSKGEVLGGLDEDVLRANLEVAQVAKEARGRLTSAEEELAFQTQNLLKIRELSQRRHASAEELTRIETQQRIAAAQVVAIREELELKVAEYTRTEAMLLQKQIRSPIDGIVTHIYKDPGEFISASDPVVLKVVKLDELLVEFAIPAKSASEFQSGQGVPLSIGSEQVKTRGVVEFVSPTTDPQSNTVRLKIRIDNSQRQFRSGDSCWLTVNSSGEDRESISPGFFTKSKPGSNSKK
jgi:membrane fusion protein (multidrug efflux system)